MKRAWIIGNGPSLLATPLDLLKDEFTIGTNRIRLIYSETGWRPKVYVRAEDVDGYNEKAVLDDLRDAFDMGIPVWVPRNFDAYVYSMRKHMKPTTVENYFRQCQHDTEPLSWHLPSICTFGSVTTVAMQVALKYGCDEICLVGVDFDYQDGKANHFSADYEMGMEAPADVVLRRQRRAFENAKASCPVPIINCTVGGKLELFPRMTIEEVLSGEGLQPGQGSAPGPHLHSEQGDDQPHPKGSANGKGRAKV